MDELTGGEQFVEINGLLIMDALPKNVLTLDDGKLTPFDVVIVTPPPALNRKFQRSQPRPGFSAGGSAISCAIAASSDESKP